MTALARQLPNGKQQFFDANGAPCGGGTVGFYIPATLTPKTTWQDSGQAVANANPVPLDAGGFAVIYGYGTYRAILKDALGNTIWDALTQFDANGLVSWGGTSGGSGNAQTISAPYFDGTDGQSVEFVAGYTNTGATTLQVNGGSIIAVKANSASGPIDLTAGLIVVGNLVLACYVASANAFVIATPSQGTLGPTSGGTGITTYTTGDMLYASATNTLATLAKGTAYQSLRMNSGATIPEWGGVDVPANNQTGTTYTFVLTDAYKWVEGNNASSITWTVPPNSSVAFELGTWIDLFQQGAGQITVAAGSGVTIRSTGSKLKLAGQYSVAGLYKRGTNEWVLFGDIAA